MWSSMLVGIGIARSYIAWIDFGLPKKFPNACLKLDRAEKGLVINSFLAILHTKSYILIGVCGDC